MFYHFPHIRVVQLAHLYPLFVSLIVIYCSLVLSSLCYGKLAGQVMIDPQNPSWMVYNKDNDGDGRLDPAFICGPGDPEDFLYRGTRNANGTRSGDQQQIINNMTSHGVNSIYFQVIRSHGGDGDSTHNPFIDSNPQKGMDDDILLQWDDWLNQLDQSGVVIYFFFYDDSARIWSGDSVGAPERAFIETLVQRYKHLKHLVWVVAEEYSERYSAVRVSKIAATIKKADNNDHVVANHQLSSLTFDHPDDPNLDQFALQYNQSTVDKLHNGMVNAWNIASRRYGLMMAESANHGDDTRAQCRKKNWASAMGGAYVMILGMDGTAPYNEKMDDCATLIRFFESTNFTTMSPHDELGNNGTWVLASPGKAYIAYRNIAGEISLANMTGGKYFAKWLDTATGTTIEQTVIIGSGTQSISKPSEIGDEVVIWLKLLDPVTPQPPASSPSLAPVNALLLGEEK